MSLFRLYALRATYLLVAVGLALQTWPVLFDHVETLSLMGGVVTAMLTAVSLLALLGVWRPLALLPLLVFELT